MKLSANLVFHDRTKHVEIQYHYIRDMVQRNTVQLKYIGTDEETTNFLTKPLAQVKFAYFRDMIEVVENEALLERES